MRKLTASNVAVSPYESIVWERGTQGTETSKYLEEKKVITISLVVVSESE